MLFSEFVEGTGCRDNEYNHKVYEELEVIYMNTECTKQHIYEMGKKLVDNSDSEETKQLKARITAEIASLNEQIKWYKDRIDVCKSYVIMGVSSKEEIRFCKQEIARLKSKISGLKWVLA